MKVVITCNAVKRGFKVIHHKDIVVAALIESAKSGVCVDVCLTYENESALKREVLIGKKDEIYGGRMAYLNIQLHVQLSGLMQRIHFLCSISVGALGSPRYICSVLQFQFFLLLLDFSNFNLISEFCTQLGIYGAVATTFKYTFDYKPSDIYWWN
ncbi:acetyl-coenzyme A synthetase, chloroplastic/glyoxysomal-like isoform X2 [Rosa chinensis]|uniref:acetyl-coenzyme A synthetase, chloroplastic/glyoxysomal-like isoform X2 n=1 Tax=Rosa chinensis TaxID=74649 RepID=UPI001AD8CB48|nr:acetyl-coenzyme A synthetase, chloroplastic/glyoxysomal-like isoform X2 [Rosa chinensis]